MFKFIFIVSTLFLSGCLLPQAPKSKDYRSIKKVSAYEIYQTYKSKDFTRKNVLFLAGDDIIQKPFQPMIQSIYKTDKTINLEDLVWWEYAPDLNKIYNQIIRIPRDKISYKNFIIALQYLESLNEPYDLILLTHGAPNYLSTGTDYFLSYKELSDLKGQLKNLGLVLMQSCYGSSLAQDWIETGAKAVLSFDDENRNYFFYGFFLKYYYPGSTIDHAYFSAINNMEIRMSHPLYKKILNIMLNEHNLRTNNRMTFQNYIQMIKAPQIVYAQSLNDK